METPGRVLRAPHASMDQALDYLRRFGFYPTGTHRDDRLWYHAGEYACITLDRTVHRAWDPAHLPDLSERRS